MWLIGVEVKQETSAPPPKKKSWIRPWVIIGNNPPSPLQAWITVQKWLIDILLLDFVVTNVYLLTK